MQCAAPDNINLTPPFSSYAPRGGSRGGFGGGRGGYRGGFNNSEVYADYNGPQSGSHPTGPSAGVGHDNGLKSDLSVCSFYSTNTTVDF